MSYNTSFGKTVLVVDDSPEFREMVCEMLESEGYDVTSFFGSLPEIEKMIFGQDWDLIILDHNLGLEKTGLEILSRMRFRELKTPLIIFSGNTDFGGADLELLVRLYHGHFLLKPATAAMLLDQVQIAITARPPVMLEA